MFKIPLAFSILFLCANLSFAAKVSEISGLRLKADSISRDYETKTLTLEGNVEISVDQELIRAQKAEVNLVTRDVLARSEVIVISKDVYLEGDEINYNLNTKVALVKGGFVQSGPVSFEGSIIRKTEENRFYAEDASYTTCATCPAGWSFSGKSIDAKIGGYAFIKYPILRFGDFPVLILPRLIVPLKSTRQSGLLVPSLGFSEKGGLALSESYFWAISRSQDMTFTLRQFQRRGLKSSIEHRYVLSPASRGETRASQIVDKSYTLDGQPRGEFLTLPRGFFHYDHHYELPDGFVQRLEVNYVTDLRYVRDFAEDFQGMHGDPSLSNNVSLAKNSENTHASIDASFYINLLKFEDSVNAQGDALSRNDDAVHRWPEIRYHIAEQEIGSTNLFWRLDFDYTQFTRRDFSYDDISGSGVNRRASSIRDGFDPNQDLIRTGHRTIIEPTLSYPIQLGKVIELLPEVSYYEAQYRFTPTSTGDYQQNASLRYLRTDIGAKTIFSGVFGGNEPLSTRYKHEIIPEITYSEIPWMERPDHVFFGKFENQPYSRRDANLTTSDFFDNVNNGLQFDYRDRVFDKRILFLGIANTLTEKYYTPSGSQYSRFLTFRVGQSYDFNEAKRSTPNPWSAITTLLDLRLKHFETLTVTETFPYANITNWSSRLKYNITERNYAEIQYVDRVTIDENNRPIDDSENQNIGLTLGVNSRYLGFRGTSNYSFISKNVLNWEYLAILKPPGDCWNIRFGHRKTAGSDIETTLSFNFDFGGV
jgi:LPS-assembly protein